MTVAEVTIERIAAGGDGIARHGELVVFVPRSAPGDRARLFNDRIEHGSLSMTSFVLEGA